jgi:hypothetical protein
VVMEVEKTEKGTRGGWQWVVLVLLCVLAYWPMFRNVYVWDDQQVIVDNPTLRGLWPLARFFRAQGPAAAGAIPHLSGQRPVVTFFLALNYALGKLNPFGYHLTNLLLHLLCVFGVVLLVQMLSRSRGAGILAGAIFALHPGHAEGVVEVMGEGGVMEALEDVIRVSEERGDVGTVRDVDEWSVLGVG